MIIHEHKMASHQILFVATFSVIACALIVVLTRDLKEKFTNVPISNYSANDKPLSFFAENKCSAECCLEGSPFSCSKGCICLTEMQKKGLLSRGNNTAYPEIVGE